MKLICLKSEAPEAFVEGNEYDVIRKSRDNIRNLDVYLVKSEMGYLSSVSLVGPYGEFKVTQ